MEQVNYEEEEDCEAYYVVGRDLMHGLDQTQGDELDSVVEGEWVVHSLRGALGRSTYHAAAVSDGSRNI